MVFSLSIRPVIRCTQRRQFYYRLEVSHCHSNRKILIQITLAIQSVNYILRI